MRISGYIACAALATIVATTPVRANVVAQACATPAQRANIVNYYAKMRPGVPLPVASRYFNLPEMAVASAIAPDMGSVGVTSSEKTVEIWRSINAWGEQTRVQLVLSPQSKHAFAFPSLVPMIQGPPEDGYLDVYADKGNGVHSHLQLSEIAAVAATDLPTAKTGFRTRGISFFDNSGELIIAVYASIKDGEPDPNAVKGFEATKALIAKLSPACS